MLQKLKAAGGWALEVATDIGKDVAASHIKPVREAADCLMNFLYG